MKKLVEQKYTINLLQILVMSGLILFVFLFAANTNNGQQLVSEKLVHVIKVPHAGAVEVVYNDKRYEVIMPIDGWNEQMNNFADGLMDDGVIVLKEFWIEEENKRLYPKEVFIDGENAVELILKNGPGYIAKNIQ